MLVHVGPFHTPLTSPWLPPTLATLAGLLHYVHCMSPSALNAANKACNLQQMLVTSAGRQ